MQHNFKPTFNDEFLFKIKNCDFNFKTETR